MTPKSKKKKPICELNRERRYFFLTTVNFHFVEWFFSWLSMRVWCLISRDNDGKSKANLLKQTHVSSHIHMYVYFLVVVLILAWSGVVVENLQIWHYKYLATFQDQIADVQTKLQLNIATKCWIYVPFVAVIVTMKVFPSWRGQITISLGKCRLQDKKKRNEPILVNI